MSANTISTRLPKVLKLCGYTGPYGGINFDNHGLVLAMPWLCDDNGHYLQVLKYNWSIDDISSYESYGKDEWSSTAQHILLSHQEKTISVRSGYVIWIACTNIINAVKKLSDQGIMPNYFGKWNNCYIANTSYDCDRPGQTRPLYRIGPGYTIFNDAEFAPPKPSDFVGLSETIYKRAESKLCSMMREGSNNFQIIDLLHEVIRSIHSPMVPANLRYTQSQQIYELKTSVFIKDLLYLAYTEKEKEYGSLLEKASTRDGLRSCNPDYIGKLLLFIADIYNFKLSDKAKKILIGK